jgi:hypothetical protein
MLFMRPADSTSGEMVSLYNHSSDKYHIICSPAQINRMFNLYTVEPGFFNKNQVQTTRNSLLLALDRRLDQLGTYAAIHGKPVVTIQASEDENHG